MCDNFRTIHTTWQHINTMSYKRDMLQVEWEDKSWCVTHVGEGVLVSVRVGNGEEVEVDLVDVSVCRGVLNDLSYGIRANCGRNPFPCVDACNEGNRYLREPEYVRNECSTWSHAKKFDTDRIRTKLSAHRARPYSCGEPSYPCCYEISIAISM